MDRVSGVDTRIRFVYATCGRRYFCIRIKKNSGYKNLRTRVDGALGLSFPDHRGVKLLFGILPD